MKRIALKPVTIPLPRDTSRDVLLSVAKAEAAMRENNKLIEQAINTIGESSGVIVSQDSSGIVHIS